MSTADIQRSLPALVDTSGQPAAKFARANAPIVPPGSVAGRSLVFVIATMAFLASLTAGGVYVAFNAAVEWTSNVSSEMTVNVKMLPGETGDEKVAEIVKFLSNQIGIRKVTARPAEQSLKDIELWVGKTDVLKAFPIPRLIEIKIYQDNPPDYPTLKKILETKFQGAILDNHGLWSAQYRRLARLMEISGFCMLLLMAAATAAVVVAAASSALASNKEIVAVLNLVGAEEKFIAGQFERHFLMVGIKAGVAGAVLAAGVFLMLPYASRVMSTAAAEGEVQRFVEAASLGIGGYAILVIVVVAIAAICKMTSRFGVRRILNQQNS